jgi:hypothetical protein
MINLDAIKKRCEAATPGPWERIGHTIDGGEYGAEEVVNADCDPCNWAGCSGARVEMREEDAAFITHAREDVLALVTAVESLKWARDTWREQATRAGERVAELEAEVEKLSTLVDHLTDGLNLLS